MISPMSPEALIACREELLKLAASWGRFKLPKDRQGRRPLKVSTLLKKEKDGTLFKHAFDGGASGPAVSFPENESGTSPSLPTSAGTAPSREVSEQRLMPLILKQKAGLKPLPRDPAKPPTRSDVGNDVKREDSREFATTITPGNQTTLGDIGIGGIFDRNE